MLSVLITVTCICILVREYYSALSRDTYNVGEFDRGIGVNKKHSVTQRILAVMGLAPAETFVALLGSVCSYSLLSLTFFHAVIITASQTTNERVRGVYSGGIGVNRNMRDDSGDVVTNAADLGPIRNWVSTLCGPRMDSYLPKKISEVVCFEEMKEHNERSVVEIGGIRVF